MHSKLFLSFIFIVICLFPHLGILKAQKLPDLIPYRKGDLWAYCDKNQKLVIPPQFHDAYPFFEGRAVVGKIKQSKDNEYYIWYGCIDTQGKLVLDFNFAYISPWQQGLAYTVGLMNGKEIMTAQIINTKGEIVIPYLPVEYNPHFSSHSEIWFIKDKHIILPDTTYNTIGVWDLTGKCKLKFDTEFYPGPLVANALQLGSPYPYFVNSTAEKGQSVLNLQGETVIPAGRFGRIEGFSEGLFVVGKLKPNGDSTFRFDHTFGYANEKGELVIDYQFVEAHPFSEGLARVSVGKSYEDALWGFIDKKGNWVIPSKFSYAENFQEGLAYVYLKSEPVKEEDAPFGKPKFIDKSGKIVIEAENPGILTNDVGYFKDGFSPTVRNGKVGFIDRSGKTVVPFRYDGIFGIGPSMYQENFRNGITRTAKLDFEFYIDTQGNEYRYPTLTGLVNAVSGLKMRQKPDSKAEVVANLDSHSIVTILEITGKTESIENTTGNWLKVKFENKEGYIFGGFLWKAYRTTAHSGLIIRANPSQTANQLASVDLNETVYLIEKTGQSATLEGKTANWFKMKYFTYSSTGKPLWIEGYAFGAFLEEIK